MLRKHGSTLSGLVAVLFLILLTTPVHAAWDQAYCSTQNTANTGVCKYCLAATAPLS
jgi:hypothetical protein